MKSRKKIMIRGEYVPQHGKKKSPSKACRISKSWKLSSKIWNRARMKLAGYGGVEELGSARGR